MNYASSSQPPNTPEARLANKQWRTINSWWILPPILSCGFLGWLGFLVAGVRTGERRYWTFAGVYAALFALFVALVVIGGEDSAVADIGAIPFLISWIAPTIHAAIWNRPYLRALAAKGDWYNTPLPATQYNPNYNTPPTAQQPFLGVSQNDYYAPPTQQRHAPAPTASTPTPPPPAPGAPAPATPAPAAWTPPPPTQHSTASDPTRPIDITTVTASDLAESTGISRALADRIINVRNARGGYRNIDDLAAAANLQPHELVRLRDRLTFDAPGHDTQTQHNTGTTGRILDL